MGLQDIDPKIQNSTALQFSSIDSTNSVLGQNFEQHGDRKGHATLGHQVGSNPVIATMILPQRTSVPGTLFLVLS
jgi:AMP deaminase